MANPGNGILGGTVTATAESGVATYSGLTLVVASSGYTLEATSSGLASVTSGALNVVPAAPAALVVLTQPASSVTAGAVFGLSVAVEDAYDNVVTSYGGIVTVALAGNPGNATLGGTTSATPAVGIATFNALTLNKADSGYTLKASSGSLPAVTTSVFSVVPAAAAQIAVTSQPPASVTAGGGFGLSVAVDDAFGNLVTAYSGSLSVDLATNPGGATLGGTSSATVVDGLAAFSGLMLDLAGTGYTLQVSGGGLAATTSNPLTVTPAAPAQLIVFVEPSATATAGRAWGTQPVVDVEDQYGNLEVDDSSTVVAASLSGGTGPLQGVTTATVSDGVATFTNLADDTAETVNLQFTSANLKSVASNDVIVSPAAASKLVIFAQPAPAGTAGQPFAPQAVIEEEDQYGNLETSDNSTKVYVSLESGSGPLQGTASVVVSGGVATFSNLADDKAETVTLAFTSGILAEAISGAVVVSPAAASQLVVHISQSATAAAGQPFDIQPVVEEQDQYGNVEKSDNSTVVTADSIAAPARSRARHRSQFRAAWPCLPTFMTTKRARSLCCSPAGA